MRMETVVGAVAAALLLAYLAYSLLHPERF